MLTHRVGRASVKARRQVNNTSVPLVGARTQRMAAIDRNIGRAQYDLDYRDLQRYCALIVARLNESQGFVQPRPVAGAFMATLIGSPTGIAI